MKPRAKLEPKKSLSARIAEYDTANPNATAPEVSKHFGVKVTAVNNARCTSNAKGRKATVDESPLSEKDIIAISKIGVDRAERIVRLLRSLKGA